MIKNLNYLLIFNKITLKIKYYFQVQIKMNKINQILPNNINNQHIPIEIISYIKEYIPKPLTDENIKQIIKYYFTYDPDELKKKKKKKILQKNIKKKCLIQKNVIM